MPFAYITSKAANPSMELKMGSQNSKNTIVNHHSTSIWTKNGPKMGQSFENTIMNPSCTMGLKMGQSFENTIMNPSCTLGLKMGQITQTP
jgi:hypothetical protein